MGRVIIHHDGLTNPVYVPLRPLKDLTGKGVMEHLQNVLTSHENLSLEHSFQVNVGTIKVPKGGKRALNINRLKGDKNSIEVKKSCIKIFNSDEKRRAHSICMGFLKLIQIPSSEWQKIETVNNGRIMEEKVLDFRNVLPGITNNY